MLPYICRSLFLSSNVEFRFYPMKSSGLFHSFSLETWVISLNWVAILFTICHNFSSLFTCRVLLHTHAPVFLLASNYLSESCRNEPDAWELCSPWQMPHMHPLMRSEKEYLLSWLCFSLVSSAVGSVCKTAFEDNSQCTRNTEQDI